MLNSFKFLFQIFPLQKLYNSFLLCISLIASSIEIGIFFISAASIEFFLFNKTDGLISAINIIDKYLGIEINFSQILILGCLLAVLLILLNFAILAVIKQKIVQLGVLLQNKILDPYLKLELDFNFERNNKNDLKVFAESLVVITEGIFLTLYLAMSRFLIILIYIIFGLFLFGINFLLVSLLLSFIFLLSLRVFSFKISSLTNNMNIIGERRLRILTNFVTGRFDIVFFGLPKLLFEKLEKVLEKLLQTKISIKTEVLKPRIVIEGALFFFMIVLGIYRVQNPDVTLTSLEILSFLLILRLLPAMQQFTSNIREATSASWAINDLRNLLTSSNIRSLSLDNVSSWTCKINQNKDSSEWISIESTRENKEMGNNTFLFESGLVNIIKGPSGAGKSTLLKTIIETLQAQDDWNCNLKEITSYLPQDPIALLTTLEQNILMGESNIGENLSKDLEEIGFTQKWMRTFDKSVLDDKMIVSGGEAQRIALLRCLYSPQKKIFLLDEPTSALDPKFEDRVASLIEAVARRGNFVIVVSHTELKIDKNYLREIYI
jgi:ABC-type transport system involved in cytochrome bd biosynthesis fused ATPase/permease subunit